MLKTTFLRRKLYGNGDPTNHFGRLRSDLWIKGEVNDDWTYAAMLREEEIFANDKANSGEEKVAFQRAYVNGRVGGVAVQAGRYNKTDITATAVGGNIYDNRMDGVQLSYGSDVKLTAGYGKATALTPSTNYDNDVAYAELTAKIGAVNANAAYYKFSDMKAWDDKDNKIWTVGVGFDVAKNIVAGVTYYDLKSKDDSDTEGETLWSQVVFSF